MTFWTAKTVLLNKYFLITIFPLSLSKGISIYMSTLTLVCIAVNRYMAIVHPHKPLMTTATAIKLVSTFSCRNASECVQIVGMSTQHSRKFPLLKKKTPREYINFPLPQVLLPTPRSIQFFSFFAACLSSCNRPAHLLLLFPFLGGEKKKKTS